MIVSLSRDRMCKSYLEPPERIGAVHVPVEEFGGLAGIVEHVLRG